ncbi:hypothetical protein H8E07_11860 [bacterium]|nr:hypothetical protein [bacterium]
MHELGARLRAAADTLLSPDCYPGELLDAAHALHEILADLAEWDDQSDEAAQQIELDAGVAIAPVDAARCILDFRRTAAYLRGTLAAITAAGADTDGPVEVLYAGCGPLAPLAVALCHRAPRARFWPVDIHRNATESVHRLVSRAGYEEQFGDIVRADAARHRWPAAGHVAIAEVMQKALEKEPQIAVAANLATQLRPGGVLVPERISLDVQLLDPAVEFDLEQGTTRETEARVRVPLVSFLQLRADNAAELMAGCEVEFEFTDPRGLQVMVSTRIDVHGDISLGDYDCGLTIPWLAHDLGRSGPGQRARLRLVPGPSPHLEASLR